MIDYEIRSISYENLIVNPENPRYHKKTQPISERDAIGYNVKEFRDYIFKLCSDITKDGLIGSKLPIVMEVPEDKTKYKVYDGNLRLTAIKIITTYKNDLDNFPFTKSQREKLLNMEYSDDRINCAVYHDLDIVRRDVIKIHTSNIGLGPQLWQGTAQDVYSFDKEKNQKKRYLVLEFMKASKYTAQSVKDAMEEKGWIRQFEVIVKNPQYVSMFGVSYSENAELLLHFDEKTVASRLSKLLMDSIDITASEMVQTSEVRNQYLRDTAVSFGITSGNIKPLKNFLFFNILTKQLTKSSILVNPDVIVKNIIYYLPPDIVDNVDPKNNDSKNNDNPNTQKNPQDGKEKHQDNENADNKNKHNPFVSNSTERSKDKPKKAMTTTTERRTLISDNQTLKIDDIRTNDLIQELKEIDVNKYTNTVSLAFRSLVEFSVNFFLEKHGQVNWAFNEKVSLIEKIEKTLAKLEAKVENSQKLKTDLAWLYNSITSYNANKNHDINSIGQLNILIHSHKYCPNAGELKNLYNNYHYYLEYLWGDYNHN